MHDQTEMNLEDLSSDEKLNIIQSLENENEVLRELMKDESISGNQKSEYSNDIIYNERKIDYIKSILEEKHL